MIATNQLLSPVVGSTQNFILKSTVCALAAKTSSFEIELKSIPKELVIGWGFERRKRIVEHIGASDTFQESQFFISFRLICVLSGGFLQNRSNFS